VISGFVLSGQSGWKEPSETDVFAGCTVSGYVRIQSKRSGVYSGNEYRKVQVVSFGDVFELNRIEPALFEQLPDTGLILIRCRTEPRLGRNGDGRVAEMDMFLEVFKLVEATPQAPSSVPPTSAVPSGRERSAKSA
jgi:hypothetical protein